MTTITSNIELIYQTALTDSGGASVCRQFLLSLWDGGEHQCDLQAMLYQDDAHFDAMKTVLLFLYTNNAQLDEYITGEQIDRILSK